MKIKSSRRLVRRLGLALAVAAVFAPSAQAMPLDMPPRGLDSVQSRLYADDIHIATPVLVSPARVYADDLHAPAVSPVNTSAQPVVSPVKSDSARFDWSDPSIGAGALLVLLGLGGVLIAVRHTRRGRLAAA